MYKVAIIDDDKPLLELMESFFCANDFDVVSFSSPLQGLEFLTKSHVDLLILDVMMPEMDGFALLVKLREFSQLPVIMLTACGAIDDKVKGLDYGADDYMAKPFEPRELLARVNSLLRRTQEKQSGKILTNGAMKLNLLRRDFSLHDRLIVLSQTEFEVMTVLMLNIGSTVSRDQIMEHLKGVDASAFDRSIDIMISRIRKKLHDDPRKPDLLKTVRGEGYMLVGEGLW